MVDIYLSPSTQEHNVCILGDREEDHMNKIVDAMIPYLNASGVTYARNDRYKMTHVEAARASNAIGCRMHYAAHTNANTNKPTIHGERCYRNPFKPAAVNAANTLLRFQRDIYRDPLGCTVNTPAIKYTEIYGIKAPIAIIDEIGYHTNRGDMTWVHGHFKEIAKNKVQAICQILGKKFVDPDAKPTNPPAPPPAKPPVTPAADPVYTVKKGDTLVKIAKVNGTTAEALMALNGIEDARALQIGAKLRIPSKEVPYARYVYAKGDYLGTIGARFGVDWHDIKREDGKPLDSRAMHVGDVLLIPKKK